MRIMYVIGFHMPDHMYRENFYPELMRDKGHEVRVVTSDLYYPFSSPMNFRERKRMIQDIKYLDKSYVIRKSPIVTYSDAVIFSIKKELLEFKPDIVHIFEARQILPVIAAFEAKRVLRNVKIVYEHEGREFNIGSFKSRIRSALTLFLLKRLMKYVDAIRVVNPESLNFIEMYCGKACLTGKNIDISSLGFDDKTFFFSENIRNDMRQRLGVSPNDIVIVTTGKNLFSILKKSNVIVKAISVLKKRYSIKSIIVGSDSSKVLSNDIDFLMPLLTPEELNKIFNASDFAIWTRYTISYFQALGTGCKIVVPKSEYTLNIKRKAHDSVFTFDIYPSEGTYLYTMKEEEIVNNIICALSNAIKVHKYNLLERSLVAKQAQDEFSWRKIGDHLEKFYQSLL